MAHASGSRRAFHVGVMFAACLGLSLWLFHQRYFLRFILLPMAAIPLLYQGPFETPTPMRVLDDFSPSSADLTTPQGLRQALNDIQALSPLQNMGTRPPIADFAGWVALIKSASMQCTDGTLLFELAAWAQGLKVREWWLLPPGWPSGAGHSMVEFFNPHTGRWQLVDGQHAGIIRDGAGQPLDMAGVLERWRAGRTSDVVVDYGPFRDIMLGHGRGPTVEEYMFSFRLLDQPVVNLRPPSYAAAPLHNDVIIGWAMYGPESRHDRRVLGTKVAAVTLVVCLAALMVALRRFLSFRKG